MGLRHVENLSRFARVVAVADAEPTRASEVASAFGAGVYEEPRELIGASEVDAVVVASPDDTHAALVMECLRHEKPVLCEKPLTTDVNDARRILETEAQLGKKLVRVGFMRRDDPQHVAVKRAVDEGNVGGALLFKGWHRNAGGGPEMTSESVLRASAVHDLDAARWMLGEEIREVRVTGVGTGREGEEGVCDLQLIQLRMSGGSLADIEVYTTARYGYEVGFEVVGKTGVISSSSPGEAVVRRDGTLSRFVEAGWLERFRVAYEVEAERWVSSLREKSVPAPDAWDGYASILAVEACVSSLRSGAPERLPEVERPRLYREEERITA